MPRDNSPVFVPACPAEGKQGVGIETRRLATGEAVALAFSSPAALAGQLGPAQPWICLTMAGFAEFLTRNGVGRVQLDPELTDELPRWSAESLVRAYGEG
jgi:hypothetical protein